MKKTKSKEDYLEYQAKYESISGLSLPYEYLEESDVYICKRKGEIDYVLRRIINSKECYKI